MTSTRRAATSRCRAADAPSGAQPLAARHRSRRHEAAGPTGRFMLLRTSARADRSGYSRPAVGEARIAVVVVHLDLLEREGPALELHHVGGAGVAGGGRVLAAVRAAGEARNLRKARIGQPHRLINDLLAGRRLAGEFDGDLRQHLVAGAGGEALR